MLPNGSDRVTTAPQQAVQTDKIIEDEGVKALLAVSCSRMAVPVACQRAGAVCVRVGWGRLLGGGALPGRPAMCQPDCFAQTSLKSKKKKKAGKEGTPTVV